MKIVVNHLTRMSEGHVCVAGIDPETLRHVRPVLPAHSLTPAVLARHGGCFDIGHVIDIGPAVPRPQTPHVEDHLFVPAAATLVGRASAGEFWALLHRVARPTLRGIFGAALKRHGRSSWGTDAGQGAASLGCVVLRQMPYLWLQPAEESEAKIRIHIRDGEVDFWAPVTDLRLYKDDHITPDEMIARRTAQRICESRCVILGVGLTREFRAMSAGRSAHWLQVNSIHLEAEPTWQLG